MVLFTDDELGTLDSEVAAYELGSPNDVRQALINRNEIMSSYAISQAEKSSSITPKMAGAIRNEFEVDAKLSFPATTRDIKSIEQNFDRQEFLNILKTFRWISANGIKRDELSLDLLADIHQKLTFHLDDFRSKFFEVLPEMIARGKSEEGKFHWYRPGQFRSADDTIVGAYKPVTHQEVKDAVKDAIAFFRGQPTLLNLNIFTAALYAIHPFSNGNKRVCRILEHALIRDLGLNRRNIYGHAHYYYRQLDRFYASLSRSLETKNLAPIVNFSREGLFFSMMLVYEEGLKSRRRAFLDARKREFGGRTRILNRLVGKKEASFGELQKSAGRSLSKRSLINYLNAFLQAGIVEKRLRGRETYYSLKLQLPEDEIIRSRLGRLGGRLPYIPEALLDVIYRPSEALAEHQAT